MNMVFILLLFKHADVTREIVVAPATVPAHVCGSDLGIFLFLLS